MPTNKNAMTRYMVLDKLLSNRYHNYTVEDLLDEVNNKLDELSIEPIGIRCLEKDIAYLKGENSPFMADIESYYTYNGKRCLRYADPSFSIFHKDMSEEEEYLLSQALSLLGQFDGLPNLEELERLRIGLAPKAERQIVSFTKNPLENSTLFAELFTAISQKQVVELHYHTFADKENRLSLLLHPYLLKEYNRRWYLFGVADSDSKMLNFSLDRIDSITPMPAHKYKEYEGQLDDWFDDIIGVTRYEGRPVLHILFWVSDKSKDYVATKPLHDSQIHYRGKSEEDLRVQYPQLHGGSFFSIDCMENYELLRELTSFGENLIVVSPDELKNKIIERISAMSEKYSSIRT